MMPIFPGFWKISLGEPEMVTPVNLRRTALAESEMHGRRMKRGYSVRLLLEEGEQLFGLGLQR